MSAVPKLRFPEFSVPLKKKNLGKLFSRRTNKGSENLPVYSVTMTRGLVRRDAMERDIGDDAKPEQNFLVAKGDIAYNTMRMWQGAVGLAIEDGMVSPAYVVLSPNEQTHSTLFSHWFKDARMLYRLWAYSYGLTSDRLRLYYDDFAKISVWVPSLPEQQKIASFLSSVDKKIDLLRQKKDALEVYKKGLTQKIFSQEIRFKQDDGSDFPDWEEVALGDVGEFSSAGVDKKIVPGEEEVRLLNFTNVYKQTKIFDADLNQVVTAPIRKVEQCDVKKGDIFFTPSSETRDDIGLSAVAAEDMSKVVYSYHVVRFRLTQVWDFNFSCFAFDRKEFRKQCYLAGDGSGQRYVISQNAFRRMILNIPSLAEQAKIGSALAAINSKIEKTSSQIDQMETFKKGLLQQMFV